MGQEEHAQQKDGSQKDVERSYVNREYKSRLFSFIFGREETKDRTLSLYNSLSGTEYTDPDDITITTIDDVVYMGMKNDLSYIVSDRASAYSTLNVNEHQSTPNPNMPVRELMYAARLYDKYLKQNRKNPYSSKIIPLPVPKLVALYNGKKEAPDESVLRLSDAFREEIRQNLCRGGEDAAGREGLEEEVEAILAKASPDIEVSVRVVNIRYGHSSGILSRCEPLKEYAWLVDRIQRNMSEEMEAEAAVNEALDSMPEDYVLKGQLMEHRAEVIGMWINEYNEEETMRMFKEEGRQEGENLLAELINRLLTLGRSDDIPRAANDRSFREDLYVQFGLKKTL